MRNKIFIGLAVVALFALGGCSLIVEKQQDNLGGTTNFDTIDTSDGYKVDGTTVIDGSGGFLVPSGQSLGIGSSTPTYDLSINTTDATSTLAGGNFCGSFQDEAGRSMYITLATSGNTVFATSTTPCNN